MTANQQQIASWLRLFVAPDQVTELRALPPSTSDHRKAVIGFYDGAHIDAMAHEAMRHSNMGHAVYFTPNPLKADVLNRGHTYLMVSGAPKHGGATKDVDVLQRKWFMVDVDPVRAKGHEKESATDAEKAAAWDVAQRVTDELRVTCGWGEPSIVVDSGNGWHLYYLVADAESTNPRSDGPHQLLQSLAHICNTSAATVDVTVGNPARIMKVPGAASRKGTHSEERPHRGCMVTTPTTTPMPATTTTDVAVRLLREKHAERFANFKPSNSKPVKASSRPGATRTRSRTALAGTTAYGLRALHAECDQLASTSAGGRNAALNQATFAVFQLVAGGEIDEQEASRELIAAARECGLDDDEITKTMRSAADAGRSQPRTAPERSGADSEATFPAIPAECLGTVLAPAATSLATGGSTANERPTATARQRRVTITTGFNEFEVNSQAIAALATHPDTFVRGGLLTHVAWQEAQRLCNNAVHIPAGPKISIVQKATLRERLTVVADWREERQSANGSASFLVEVRPPDWCVSGVLARGSWSGIPPLVGVAEFPVFLLDGSILSTHGYHASSGLYCAQSSPCAIDVSEMPTHADAVHALDVLAEVVCDFPFVAAHHRSAWLAGLLTPLARHAFAGPTPLFLVEANAPGVGKGLLTNVANLIVRGELAATAEYTREGDELQKVLTAILLQGETITSFDNVEGTIGGGVLNKLLTSELWEGRILGQSETRRVPNLCTWWANGNNISILGDTARRVCSIRLESPHENPETRQDVRHQELDTWVRANRSRLLSAALTLLKAYHVAGRPAQPMRPWGSYVAWSKLIRGAIIWAGWPDPLAEGTVERQVDDPVRGAMTVLLEEWETIDRDRRGLTSAGIVEAIGQLSTGGESLREALEILAPANSRSRSTMLGYRLREYLNRNIGGRILCAGSQRKGLGTWLVRLVAGPTSTTSTGQPDEQKEGHEAHEGHAPLSTRVRCKDLLGNDVEDVYAPTVDGLGQCPSSPSCPSPTHHGAQFEIDLGGLR